VHTGIVLIRTPRRASKHTWPRYITLRYVPNEYGEHFDMYEAPARVYPSGLVEHRKYVRTAFLCDSNIGAFPFDTHDCYIDVVSANALSNIQLTVAMGFNVYLEDKKFTAKTAARVYAEDNSAVARYNIKFERISIGAWLRMIIPACLLNLIGFMAL